MKEESSTARGARSAHSNTSQSRLAQKRAGRPEIDVSVVGFEQRVNSKPSDLVRHSRNKRYHNCTPPDRSQCVNLDRWFQPADIADQVRYPSAGYRKSRALSAETKIQE
jgi:hypothetical protein